MDPIVQVLIDRIEALAVDKAGLKGQLLGLRQDVSSAERHADRVSDELQELRTKNARLVGGLKVIRLSLYDTHESLVGKIEEVLRQLQLTSGDEGEK